MSKLTSFIEKVQGKITWKVVACIAIGCYLVASCKGCNHENKIERLEKNHITYVDSINNVVSTMTVKCDSLRTEIEKRDLIIEGKNEVKDALNLNKNASDIAISNLNDTIRTQKNTIKNLKREIRKKDGEISNLNIEIGRLKRENAELSQQ